MDNLNINATKDTPYVEFQNTGFLSLRGYSYPENALEFYDSILFWLEEYFFHNQAREITINFTLIYFDFSSFHVLLDIFDIFKKNMKTTSITINWFYHEEDESSFEDGENLSNMFPDLNVRLLVCD